MVELSRLTGKLVPGAAWEKVGTLLKVTVSAPTKPTRERASVLKVAAVVPS